MAKKETAKESPKKDARALRWEAFLRLEKENNPSVYDTKGGDKQLDAIPADFK
jgi:hypothetical protein